MSFKFRVLMTLRNAFVELCLGLFMFLFGLVQLVSHKAWPDSAPVEPVIPFVAIYWGLMILGVVCVIWAHGKANDK